MKESYVVMKCVLIFSFVVILIGAIIKPVSYTHLDVYKRQLQDHLKFLLVFD